MKKINIGMLGFGNVGKGTYEVLEMNSNSIKNSLNFEINFKKILVRSTSKSYDYNIGSSVFTSDPKDIFEDNDIDVVVELIGGVEPATSYMIQAMKHKKNVVTANKAAVAENFDLLIKTAKENDVEFKYEASVAGGIPILNSLLTSLQGNQFLEVQGIVNGTTNYILTQMTEFGSEYTQVLKKAQELGFAEADPTADVEGIDAANKLTILMKIMFDKYVHPSEIPTEGISKINLDDIKKAKENNSKIKLIAYAKKTDDKIEYGVKPIAMNMSHPLSSVNNEFNAVYVTGNAVGELMFYGKGAGPLPTGSAVVGDILEICKMI